VPEHEAVTTRPLKSTAERIAAAQLYREVMGLAGTGPTLPNKLLSALAHHGGSAVGAFDGAGRLVGFGYGFVGLDAGQPYHHSQLAVVHPDCQGRGVGRALKQAQARVALGTGVQRMRWAYDPLVARNAHFNLDVLGARGRWFVRDYYEMESGALRTDRILVDWLLSHRKATTNDVAQPSAVPAWGEVTDDGARRWLAIPAEWDALLATDPERAARVRDAVAEALADLLGAGAAELVSCRRVEEATAVYRIEPTGERT
jgi:predicted GNAT superfamily acetyltransferase